MFPKKNHLYKIQMDWPLNVNQIVWLVVIDSCQSWLSGELCIIQGLTFGGYTEWLSCGLSTHPEPLDDWVHPTMDDPSFPDGISKLLGEQHVGQWDNNTSDLLWLSRDAQ